MKCNMHPWMKGYIAVFKHPYFAVTDKNGSFELKDLPPGTYTITAWQEKLGTQIQKVTVGSGRSQNAGFHFQAVSASNVVTGLTLRSYCSCVRLTPRMYREHTHLLQISLLATSRLARNCRASWTVDDVCECLAMDVPNTGWKKHGRTSPDASITAETQGALQRGATFSAWPEMGAEMLDDAAQFPGRSRPQIRIPNRTGALR